MDKYLLEILKEVNTIIIPGLGALTIINADKGEIMFMSYLKHDDGKLTSYISKNEGIDENEAMNLVAKYVREIQIELNKGESYDMYQFGSFYKNHDEIDFKSWAQMHESTQEEPKNQPEQNETTTKKQPEENIYVATKKEDKGLTILEKEERKATEAKLDQLRNEQTKKSAQKKRSVGFYILLLFVALILGGGTFWGVNYTKNETKESHLISTENSPKKTTTHSEKSEEVLPDVISEVDAGNNNDSVEGSIDISVESTQDSEIEPAQEEPLAQSVNTETDFRFHIITGAFSSESNANRLGDKLRDEGYTVTIGEGRGMTLVSIQSFQTKAEAKARLIELKEVTPNGWVYKW